MCFKGEGACVHDGERLLREGEGCVDEVGFGCGLRVDWLWWGLGRGGWERVSNRQKGPS